MKTSAQAGNSDADLLTPSLGIISTGLSWPPYEDYIFIIYCTTDNSELIQLQRNTFTIFIFSAYTDTLTRISDTITIKKLAPNNTAQRLRAVLVFMPWQIRIYVGTRVTLAAGFRALPQIPQPGSCIVLRLAHDDFHPNSFHFSADQSTCVSRTTVRSAVHCIENFITYDARK